MSKRHLCVVFALFTLGASSSFGCSDGDAPPAASSSSGGTSSGAAPSPTAPNGGDGRDGGASEGGSVDAGCGVAEHASDEIGEVAMNGEAPPPLGGEILPGTYVLSEMNAYIPEDPDAGPPTGPGSELTDVVGRGTIVIDETTMRVLRSRTKGNEAPTTEQGTFTYAVEGTSLKRTKTCPGSPVDDTVPFTAAGSGLALYVDAQHRELYVRIE